MVKRALTLTLLFCLLVGPAALAAELRSSDELLKLEPECRSVPIGLGRMADIEDWLEDLEELQEQNPDAAKQELRKRFEQMVAHAERIVKEKDSLAQQLIDRAKERQSKEVKRATQAAAKSKDPKLAQKRLAYVKAKHEFLVARMEKNAARIAANMVARAERLLSQADNLRARIERGEGLDMLKEHIEQRKKPMRRLRRDS